MNNNNEKSRKKTIIIILLLIILAGCIVTLVVLVRSLTEEKPPVENAKGVVGTIVDNWDPNVSRPDERSDQKKGTMIPGYSSATMNEGDTSLKLSVGNPKENTVGFFATVKLADGTVLYTSPLLKPGQGLEEIPLNKSLSKGTYNAIVFYQCVLLDEEHTPLNAAESAFTLIVN